MSHYVSVELRQRLEMADGRLCAYCQTSVDNSGQPLTIDHIYPSSQDGSTEFENLCLACRQCNEFKQNKTSGIDPLLDERISLFNPRRNKWQDHFQWDGTGTQIEGVTPTGRVTVIVLNMNNALIVSARHRWIVAGWHPPNLK